jgi:ABC-type glycerol-3-phosphate transport system substrate-binding protein
MKYVFLAGLFVFLGLYAFATLTLRPETGGEVVLRWATDPNPARDRQSEDFAKANPGFQVVTETGDPTKLLVQCATGVGPDVMDLSESMMHSMVQAGLLMDLTDLAAEHGFDPLKTYPAIRDALGVDGRQYRFPANVNVQAVLYNRAIFDDHGVPYPKPDWTWDDFVVAARAILETPSKSGRTHIPVAHHSPHDFFSELLVARGGRYFSEDGLQSRMDSPAAIAAFQDYHDLIFKHHVLPTPEQSVAMSSQGGWGAGGINWFAAGDAAMIIIGRWFIVQAANFPELQDNLGAARLPRMPGQPSRGFTRARGVGVNAKTKNPEAAVRFLMHLNSPEYGRSIVEDGDSLPPNPGMAKDGAGLANTSVPDRAFHQVFVDAIGDAVPLDTSPFVDAGQTQRWVQESLGRIENRVATPEQAAKELASELNRAIARNIERQPELRARAEALKINPKAPSKL